jgi:MHS family proline/betaine transporter-like MFS transporter
VFESLEKKGLALGIMFGLVLSGFAFGEGMSIILRLFFGEYAWRAAFISGSLIGFIAYYIRSRLNETDLFKHLHHKEKFPPAVLFRDYFQNTIGATLCVTIVAFYGAIVSLYLPKYLTQHLNYDIKYVNLIMLYSAILSSGCVIFISWLSDFVNHRKFFKYLSFALIIIAYPVFSLINTNSTIGLILGVLIISVITSLATGLFMKICCEAFPTNVRLTGVAVAYNFAFAILGGLAPITTEILIKVIGLSFGPSIIAMLCGLCGLCSIPLLTKRQFID